ncbi:MAG: NAD(P)-dependent oxidoreductase [Fervidicoccaceae archaeon]|jgi:lactate dehydrogenase-like 2-hydroxyacid dehydrogenase
MKVAIVRYPKLELFGLFTDVLEKLKKIAEVEELYGSKDEKELATQLKGFDVAITEPMMPRFGKEFFEHNNDIRLVFVHGRGYDNIDVDAAYKKGVIVARVPGWCENEAVAEHALALILEGAKKLWKARTWVSNGEWEKVGESGGYFLSPSIREMAICVIGFGYIGSRLARILKNGFGAEILVYDPYVPSGKIKEEGYTPFEDLHEMLEKCDAISINAELTNETFHMISEKEFELMKDGVIIVNTARGAILDTDALIGALKNGKIAFAGLDVVEGEPISSSHPLLNYENVLITPHVAYATNEAIKCMDYSTLEAVESLMKGKEIREIIVPKAKYL